MWYPSLMLKNIIPDWFIRFNIKQLSNMPSDQLFHYFKKSRDFIPHLYPNGHVVSAIKPDADYSQIEDEELRETVELSYNEKLDFLLYGEYEGNYLLRDLENSSYLLLPKNMFINN